MADDQQYDEARNLAKDAPETFVNGHDKEAEQLAEKSKAADWQAAEDLLREMDEEASSEHDIAEINRELRGNVTKH
jgi:hypothetical protein